MLVGVSILIFIIARIIPGDPARMALGPTATQEMVEQYTFLKTRRSYDSMYEEAKWQYQDMAKGGDGGELGFERNGETTCRGINYKGYPNSFFRRVCEGMGWMTRNDTITLVTYSADPV